MYSLYLFSIFWLINIFWKCKKYWNTGSSDLQAGASLKGKEIMLQRSNHYISWTVIIKILNLSCSNFLFYNIVLILMILVAVEFWNKIYSQIRSRNLFSPIVLTPGRGVGNGVLRVLVDAAKHRYIHNEYQWKPREDEKLNPLRA